MSKYAHAEVVGLDQLMQNLAGLSDELLMGAARKGMQKTLTRMRDNARMRCPEDTGELRSKIHYTTKVIASHVRGELVSSAEHAVFVEMGTGPKGEAGLSAKGDEVSPQIRARVKYATKGWKCPTGETNPKTGKPEYRYTEGMEPKPYLYPAYKEHANQMLGDVKEQIHAAIRKEGLGE